MARRTRVSRAPSKPLTDTSSWPHPLPKRLVAGGLVIGGQFVAGPLMAGRPLVAAFSRCEGRAQGLGRLDVGKGGWAVNETAMQSRFAWQSRFNVKRSLRAGQCVGARCAHTALSTRAGGGQAPARDLLTREHATGARMDSAPQTLCRVARPCAYLREA